MSVEFISMINVWESSEVHPRPGGAPDAAWVTFRPIVAATDDHGRFVLPLVRQELAHRAATGQHGAVVPQPPISPAADEPRKVS
jgi:hypothetical protein